MTLPPASHPQAKLAGDARVWLLSQAAGLMQQLVPWVRQRLLELLDEAGPSRTKQLHRDTWGLYQKAAQPWLEAVLREWQSAWEAPKSGRPASAAAGEFKLVDEQEVEDGIRAAHLVQELLDAHGDRVERVLQIVRTLQGQEVSRLDVLRPNVLMLPVVRCWREVGLPPEAWSAVMPAIGHPVCAALAQIYADCEAWLAGQGVQAPGMKVVLSPQAVPARRGAGAVASPRRRASDRLEDRQIDIMAGQGAPRSAPVGAGMAPQRLLAEVGQWLAAPRQPPLPAVLPQGGTAAAPVLPAGSSAAVAAAGSAAASAQVGLAAAGGPSSLPAAVWAAPISPQLQAALQAQPPVLAGDVVFQQPLQVLQAATPAVIERVGSALRSQSTALKSQAGTDQEKAIIEMVALMFQAILQEDRIPTGIRVWFARLQMPVVRVALAEPTFLTQMDHPARQLIDHMGSCVLGFDTSAVDAHALEIEIQRVVQVIEQYPETGERVFRKVYEEFQAFLKRHLADKPTAQKVAGVAQQLEQKETLAVQFTIELRQQLEALPVHAAVRDFLFKVWTDVLAVAAIRLGAQAQATLALKKTASQLIWAASAKPSRMERAKVIADLPGLLQSLREGMALLGLEAQTLEAHLKQVSDVLADAFMSKTESISDAQIQELARHLATLEDGISDELEELPLDAEAIEELLGIDASNLEVILDGGDVATPVMLEWAAELTLGSWFKLTHQGQMLQVQMVWRSPMGHLTLFASSLGRGYLIQKARLAGYLRAGLLEPQEQESLTLRATRDALQKLQANPSQLLS